MEIQRIERINDDGVEFRILFENDELITSMPSAAEIIAKKLYDKTHTIADALMYFSEVAQRIEEHKKG